MAERRTTNLAGATAVHDIALFFGGIGVSSAWYIRDADDAVMQPFYAALDGAQRICWTDDRLRAQRFESKQAAERFAVDRFTTEVVVVATA